MNADRDMVFDDLRAMHGWVPCYVCGGNVKRRDATLEHIIPRSKGGAEAAGNYSISHRVCNSRKGDALMRSASPLSERGEP